MTKITVPILETFRPDKVLGSVSIDESALTGPDLILAIGGKVNRMGGGIPDMIQVKEFGLIPLQNHLSFRQLEGVCRDTEQNLTHITNQRNELIQDVAVLKQAEEVASGRAARAEAKLADLCAILRVMELSKDQGDEWTFQSMMDDILKA